MPGLARHAVQILIALAALLTFAPPTQAADHGPAGADAPAVRYVYDHTGALADEQHFLCNRRGDVVAIVGPGTRDSEYNVSIPGPIIARVYYWAYGEPRICDPADMDKDGDVDSADFALWDDLFGSGAPDDSWNNLLDFDRDGYPGDSLDYSAFADAYSAADVPALLARLGNLPLYAGYWWDGMLEKVSRAAGVGGGVGSPSTLGLYHVRNRAYDPALGRWLQRDPIGYAGGANLYQYVGGQPLSMIDPSGTIYMRYLGKDCSGNDMVDDVRTHTTQSERNELARIGNHNMTIRNAMAAQEEAERDADNWRTKLAAIADGFTLGWGQKLRHWAWGAKDTINADTAVYQSWNRPARLGGAIIMGGVVGGGGGFLVGRLAASESAIANGAAMVVTAYGGYQTGGSLYAAGAAGYDGDWRTAAEIALMLASGGYNGARGFQAGYNATPFSEYFFGSPKLGPVAVGPQIASSCEASEAASTGFSLTRTVANGLPSRPYLRSPLTIQEVMAAGKPIRDPGGSPGGLRWDVPGHLNGSPGIWELVIDPATNTVLHFLFKGT